MKATMWITYNLIISFSEQLNSEDIINENNIIKILLSNVKFKASVVLACGFVRSSRFWSGCLYFDSEEFRLCFRQVKTIQNADCRKILI